MEWLMLAGISGALSHTTCSSVVWGSHTPREGGVRLQHCSTSSLLQGKGRDFLETRMLGWRGYLDCWRCKLLLRRRLITRFLTAALGGPSCLLRL